MPYSLPLLRYYPCDDATGTVLHDEMGVSDATAGTSTTWVAGPYTAGALNCTKTTGDDKQHIGYGDATGLPLNQDNRTIIFACKPESGADNEIFSYGTDGGINPGYRIAINSGNKLYVQAGNRFAVSSAVESVAEAWNFCIVTYIQASNSIRFYCNGARELIAMSAGAWTTDIGAGSFMIGASSDTGDVDALISNFNYRRPIQEVAVVAGSWTTADEDLAYSNWLLGNPLLTGPTIATRTISDLTVGEIKRFFIEVNDHTTGTAPYTIAVTAGSLPPDTTLGSTTLLWESDCTTVGDYTFTLTITDVLLQTDSCAYTVRVRTNRRTVFDWNIQSAITPKDILLDNVRTVPVEVDLLSVCLSGKSITGTSLNCVFELLWATTGSAWKPFNTLTLELGTDVSAWSDEFNLTTLQPGTLVGARMTDWLRLYSQTRVISETNWSYGYNSSIGIKDMAQVFTFAATKLKRVRIYLADVTIGALGYIYLYFWIKAGAPSGDPASPDYYAAQYVIHSTGSQWIEMDIPDSVPTLTGVYTLFFTFAAGSGNKVKFATCPNAIPSTYAYEYSGSTWTKLHADLTMELFVQQTVEIHAEHVGIELVTCPTADENHMPITWSWDMVGGENRQNYLALDDLYQLQLQGVAGSQIDTTTILKEGQVFTTPATAGLSLVKYTMFINTEPTTPATDFDYTAKLYSVVASLPSAVLATSAITSYRKSGGYYITFIFAPYVLAASTVYAIAVEGGGATDGITPAVSAQTPTVSSYVVYYDGSWHKDLAHYVAGIVEVFVDYGDLLPATTLKDSLRYLPWSATLAGISWGASDTPVGTVKQQIVYRVPYTTSWLPLHTAEYTPNRTPYMSSTNDVTNIFPAGTLFAVRDVSTIAQFASETSLTLWFGDAVSDVEPVPPDPIVLPDRPPRRIGIGWRMDAVGCPANDYNVGERSSYHAIGFKDAIKILPFEIEIQNIVVSFKSSSGFNPTYLAYRNPGWPPSYYWATTLSGENVAVVAKTVPKGVGISQITLWCQAGAGLTNNIKIRLYNSIAGVPTGSILSETAVVAVTDASTFVTFTFASQYVTPSEGEYVFVAHLASTDQISFGYDISSSVLTASTNLLGTGWTNQPPYWLSATIPVANSYTGIQILYGDESAITTELIRMEFPVDKIEHKVVLTPEMLSVSTLPANTLLALKNIPGSNSAIQVEATIWSEPNGNLVLYQWRLDAVGDPWQTGYGYGDIYPVSTTVIDSVRAVVEDVDILGLTITARKSYGGSTGLDIIYAIDGASIETGAVLASIDFQARMENSSISIPLSDLTAVTLPTGYNLALRNRTIDVEGVVLDAEIILWTSVTP